MEGFVEVDGSILEGGGQILRNSVAFAALLEHNVHIHSIRQGRKDPGLKAQHLCGIQLVTELCKGKLIGGEVKSRDIRLEVPKLKTRESKSADQDGVLIGDTKTAGSICLLIQSVLPPLLYGVQPMTTILKGGSNASMAPQIDYTTHVLLPALAKMGVSEENVNIEIKMRGFYPKGRGEVVLHTKPVRHIKSIQLTKKGSVTKIEMLVFYAGKIPAHVPQRIEESATAILNQHSDVIFGTDFEQEKILKDILKVRVIHETFKTAFGEGCGILLFAHTTTGCIIAGSSLGERGVKSEDVGAAAANELIQNLAHGGCVDEYLQDQLIIFMALAEGTSKILSGPISLHTKTAIHIAQLFTKAKFDVSPMKNEKGEEITDLFMITCEGIGFQNPHFL